MKTFLQERLDYRFKNPELLERALTHSSWAHEAGQDAAHNERLEFLGDAVLELCVSSELYERYPEAREGSLTSLRAHLVGEKNLAALARQIGVDKCLALGRGEERQGGRQRDSVLSDAMEAVMAAIYLDGGFAAAQKTARGLFARQWPREAISRPMRDNKSCLQEYCQKNFKSLPEYVLLGASGPEHAKIFEMAVLLPDGRKFAASASNGRKAEQACAGLALAELLGEAGKN